MMVKLIFSLIVVIIVREIACSPDEESDEDTSLVKLLSQQGGEKVATYQEPYKQQHLQEIEANINGGGSYGDEVPIRLPANTELAFNDQNEVTGIQDELSASDVQVQAAGAVETINHIDFEPKEKEEDNAQKREQERYEAQILGNPRPKIDTPEKIESFVKLDAHDIGNMNMEERHMEMEEGDAGKEVKQEDTDALKPALKHAKNNADESGQANINKIQESLKSDDENANRQYVLDVKNDSVANFKNEDKSISQFSAAEGVQLLDVHHAVEPESSADELTLNEEERLSRKLYFLKNKLKEKHRLAHLKEQHRVQQEEQHLKASKNEASSKPEQQKPKYSMHRLDNNDSNKILNNNVYKFDISTLTESSQKNITDVGHARGPGLIMSKALFSFSYDPDSSLGPLAWQTLNPEWTCSAHKQSPINIESAYVIDNQIVKNIMIKTYPPNSPLTGVLRNNGHAPTFSLSNDISVKLFGGTLPNDYYLKQLHFHFGCDSSTGSEHHIDGVIFPLELHLVFWDNSTFATFPAAAKADRGIAVVSIIFQLETVQYFDAKNTPLPQVTQTLRHIEEEGDNITITDEFNFRLEKMVPNVMNPDQVDRFFLYEGSLSTPGCYESVTWIVLATHPPVIESQLRIFRNLKSSKVGLKGMMCNNYRPVQKKNGRRIYSNIV